MDNETIDRFTDLSICSAITTIAINGGVIPTGLLESLLATGGIVRYLKKKKQANLVNVLERFRVDLEKNWEAWSGIGAMNGGNRAESASMAFKEVLPHLYALPGEIVNENLDSDRIANLFLKRAEDAIPSLYSESDFDCADARLFLKQLVSSAISHLLNSADYVKELQPHLWKRAFTQWDDIETQVKLAVSLLQEKTNNDSDLERETLKRQIAEVKSKHDKNRLAVMNLLVTILQRNIPVEMIETEIKNAESRAEELIKSIRKFEPGDSKVISDLKVQAEQSLIDRNFTHAELFFRKILAERKKESTYAADQTARAIGDIARTVEASLDYLRASKMYEEASQFPGISEHLIWFYRFSSASMISDHGKKLGVNTALEESIRRLEVSVLPLVTAENNPDEWAKTHSLIGIVKATLAERIRDTDLLGEAINGFILVLQLYTREISPSKFATTSSYLGSALCTMGDALQNEKCMNSSIENFKNCLEIHSRKEYSHEWAIATQNMAGSVVGLARIKDNDLSLLSEATEMYLSALEELTESEHPIDRALVLRNMGDAYHQIYLVDSELESLESSITFLEKAHALLENHYAPIQLAITTKVLANSVHSSAQVQENLVQAKYAVKLFESSIKELVRREQYAYVESAKKFLKKAECLVLRLKSV